MPTRSSRSSAAVAFFFFSSLAIAVCDETAEAESDNALACDDTVFLQAGTKLLLRPMSLDIVSSHNSQQSHSDLTIADDLVGPAVVALLVFAIAILCLSLLLRRAKKHETPVAEVARTVGCYFMAVDNIVFTVVIPSSFDLLRDLGGTAVASGMMVGVFKLGHAIGATLYFVLAKRHAEIWRNRSRSIMMTCAMVNTAAMALYVLVGAVAGRGSVHVDARRRMIYVLMLSRVLSGCAAGVRSMLQRAHVARLTPLGEKPLQQGRLIFSSVVGTGFGPLLASAADILGAYFGSSAGRYDSVVMVSFMLVVSQPIAALCLEPLVAAQDELSLDELPSGPVLDDEESKRRRSVMFFCLSFSLCRCVITSGLEVASAMILEVQMGWPREYLGVIGVSFLAIIPVRHLCTKLGWSAESVIRSLLGVALCGIIFLFPLPWLAAGSHTSHPALLSGGVLLLGDTLVSGGFFLSDGLAQGILMQHLLPRSVSFLNVNTVNLASVILMDGFGRSIGPPLARLQVSHGGQSRYAFQQLIIALGAFALAVVGFMPRTAAAAGSPWERQDKARSERGSLRRHTLDLPAEAGRPGSFASSSDPSPRGPHALPGALSPIQYRHAAAVT